MQDCIVNNSCNSFVNRAASADADLPAMLASQSEGPGEEQLMIDVAGTKRRFGRLPAPAWVRDW